MTSPTTTVRPISPKGLLATRLAAVSLWGTGLFVLTQLALHGLSLEFDPATRFMSEYVHGSYGYLFSVGLVALGAGSLALAAALGRSLPVGWPTRIGLLLLVVWGLGVIVAGVVPLDRGVEPVTTAGMVHLIASMAAFTAFVVGSIVLSLRLRRAARWHRMARPALVVAVLVLLAFLTSIDPPEAVLGLTQRVFIALCAVWLAVVAAGLRSVVRTEGQA